MASEGIIHGYKPLEQKLQCFYIKFIKSIAAQKSIHINSNLNSNALTKVFYISSLTTDNEHYVN